MDEKINFGLVLKESAGLPMVKIDREGFLRAALSPHFDEDTVCRAISVNPAYAGITTQEIKKIARSCINYNTFVCGGNSWRIGDAWISTSGLSAVLRSCSQNCTEIDLFVWLAGVV